MRLFKKNKLPAFITDQFESFPEGFGLFEVVGIKANGKTFPAEVVILPYEKSLRQILVRDISERRATEEMWLQAERLTAMGKLAGEIAHEINNPLGGILLYANLLKEDLEQEGRLWEYTDKIIKLATKCRIIAKALLNFGRPDTSLNDWIDINRLLIDMFALIEDHRLFREVDIVWELEKQIPLVQGNRSQLEQLTLNLIINAGEALNGKGRIIFRTYFSTEEEMVVMEVEDNGPGIPQEILPRIFEPFFTTKKGGKGTGLGLSICHGIVKRHEGKIEVKSKPGQTIFKVKLPRIHFEHD